MVMVMLTTKQLGWGEYSLAVLLSRADRHNAMSVSRLCLSRINSCLPLASQLIARVHRSWECVCLNLKRCVLCLCALSAWCSWHGREANQSAHESSLLDKMTVYRTDAKTQMFSSRWNESIGSAEKYILSTVLSIFSYILDTFRVHYARIRHLWCLSLKTFYTNILIFFVRKIYRCFHIPKGTFVL